MSKAKIITARLHEMFIAGAKPSDMAAEFDVSIPGITSAIGHQRLLYPDKWPKRKGGILEYVDAPKERVPIVATRPPLKPVETPRNTDVKTYQMTDEDRERVFGKPGDAKNMHGERIKQPVMVAAHTRRMKKWKSKSKRNWQNGMS